ncbi:MAG: hypothetical protein AAB360_04380 [Patescibacteria group bacterium]
MKRNFFFLFTVTLFATTSVFLDLFNYNPYQADFKIFLNFYLSFLLSLGGILALVMFYLKYRYLKTENLSKFFWVSVRQGLIISLAATILLLLKNFGLLDWWIGASFTIVIILLELFFQTKNKNVPKAKGRKRKEQDDPNWELAP